MHLYYNAIWLAGTERLQSKVMRVIRGNTTSARELAVINQRLCEFASGASQMFAEEQKSSFAEDVDLIADQENYIWYLLFQTCS